jgi:uncharacterized membrane protein
MPSFQNVTAARCNGDSRRTIAMSELVAIAYPDKQRAEQVLTALGEMQNAYLIDLEDACYVTKDAQGRVKLHQAYPTTDAGAGGGAIFGGLMGLMLGAFVLMPVAGAAIGAGIGAGAGALAGHWSDYGIDDNFIKQLGAALTPDSSAIIVLVRRSTPEKVLPEIGRYGGTVLHTSLSPESEAMLQSALTRGLVAEAFEMSPGASGDGVTPTNL